MIEDTGGLHYFLKGMTDDFYTETSICGKKYGRFSKNVRIL